jgi:cysteine desulfurase/selenocysteine lyase
VGEDQAVIGSLVPRSDFPLLTAHSSLCYLDSAATSQKPCVVIDAISHYYGTVNANPHRGAYALSAAATEVYQHSRDAIAAFLGVADPDTLIFTRGTTESLNLVATAWGRANVKAGDRVVVTRMEHHANFVPWQQLCLAVGAEFRIAELTPLGEIDMPALAALITPNTKVVAFAHVSNALGTINDVGAIVRLARAVGAIAVCDGAQAVPHIAVNFDSLGVDFYAFSGHKMLGPMGIGGLISSRALLEQMPPYQMGGDMIASVGDTHTTWNVLPHKFEAGTPNVEGAVGLAAAVGYLSDVGLERIHSHETSLVALAMKLLAELPGVTVLGPPGGRRSGVVAFTVDGVHPHDLSQLLDAEGIAVRAGHHCAQPLMRASGLPATTRASFYLYNSEADVKELIAAVEKANKKLT